MRIGIRPKVVTPVRVKDIAAPLKPSIGTRIKRETRYWIAEPAIKIPDILGFPIPIKIEESVCPNIRRNVPNMRI